MLHDGGGVGKHVIQDIIQYIVHVVIVQIEGAPVDLGHAAQLRHRNF